MEIKIDESNIFKQNNTKFIKISSNIINNNNKNNNINNNKNLTLNITFKKNNLNIKKKLKDNHDLRKKYKILYKLRKNTKFYASYDIIFDLFKSILVVIIMLNLLNYEKTSIINNINILDRNQCLKLIDLRADINCNNIKIKYVVIFFYIKAYLFENINILIAALIWILITKFIKYFFIKLKNRNFKEYNIFPLLMILMWLIILVLFLLKINIILFLLLFLLNISIIIYNHFSKFKYKQYIIFKKDIKFLLWLNIYVFFISDLIFINIGNIMIIYLYILFFYFFYFMTYSFINIFNFIKNSNEYYRLIYLYKIFNSFGLLFFLLVIILIYVYYQINKYIWVPFLILFLIFNTISIIFLILYYKKGSKNFQNYIYYDQNMCKIFGKIYKFILTPNLKYKKRGNDYFEKIINSSSKNNGNKIVSEWSLNTEIILNKDQNPDIKEDCFICLTTISNSITEPCNHGNLCIKCALINLSLKNNCYLCNKHINYIVEVSKDNISKYIPINYYIKLI